MDIAAAIYFGVGFAVALWALTGDYDSALLNERRQRVTRRLGGVMATAGFIAVTWPYLLAQAFFGKEAA